jgi:hypothetical protein
MAELEDAAKQKLRFITRTSLITLSPSHYLGSMTAKVTRRTAEELGSVPAQAPKAQPSPEGLKAAMRLNKAVLFLHNMMLQSFTALKQFRNTLPDDLNQHPAGEPLLNILTDIRRLQKPLTELHQRTQQLVGALNGQKTAARKLGSVDAPNEAMEFAARVRKIAQLADAADAAILAGNKERADKLMQLASLALREAAAPDLGKVLEDAIDIFNEEKDYEAVYASLENYWKWRKQGAPEPKVTWKSPGGDPGDAIARKFEKFLGVQIEKNAADYGGGAPRHPGKKTMIGDQKWSPPGDRKEQVALEIRELRKHYLDGMVALLKRSNLTPESQQKIIEYELDQIRRNLLP